MVLNQAVEVPRFRHDSGAKTGAGDVLLGRIRPCPAAVSSERRFQFVSLSLRNGLRKAGATALTASQGDLPQTRK